MNLNQIKSKVRKKKITSVIGSVICNPTLSQVLSNGNDGNVQQIKNIADPTNNQDALTLAYFNAHNTSGSSTFVSLTDGPGAFTGKTLNLIRVNAGETALEYRTPAQVLSDLGAQATLSNGNGTTYSSNKIDLGGAPTGDINIIGTSGSYNFKIGSVTSGQIPFNGFDVFVSSSGSTTTYSRFQMFSSIAQLLSINSSLTTGKVFVNASGATIQGTSGGTIFTSIASGTDSTGSLKITDNRTIKEGIVYNADYSATYINRSLIDKGYSDTHLIGLTFTNSPSTNYIPQYNGTNFTWAAISAGFSNPMTTLGDIIYEDATPSAAKLAGNTTSSMKVLTQTGNGVISAAPVWTTTTGSAGLVVLSQSPIFSGTPTLGTLSYSDTGILWSWQSSTNSYNQVIIQNTSSGSVASTNYNVSNDAGTSTTNFAEFGINSSGFTGTGAFSQAGYAYLASASTDLVLGTYANKSIHFVVNSGATDALTISGSQLFTFTAPVPNNSFTSTWIATANNQNAFNFTGTLTSRNIASDIWSYIYINPTMTRNAANPGSQIANILFLNPTFTNTPSIRNYIMTQDAGTEIFSVQRGSGFNGVNFYGNTNGYVYFGLGRATTNEAVIAIAASAGDFFNNPNSAAGDMIIKNANSTNRILLGTGNTQTLTFLGNGSNAVGFLGIGNNSPTARLQLGSNISASAWTTTGIQMALDAATYTDTGATGTRVTGVAIGIAQPTFTNATSAVITITDAATWYVANAPTSSNTSTGSMTLTRSWALWIDAGNSRFDGNLDFSQADATNIVLGTSTGTKFGTSTSQKLAFYNSTPIIQPTTGIAAATFVANTSLIANDSATWDGYTTGQVVKALRNLGFLA